MGDSMGTITVSIDDEVERKFRKIAGKIYHKKKGYLGRTVTEAMRQWVYEQKQKKITERQLKLLGKFNLGKKLYKSREDLYER